MSIQFYSYITFLYLTFWGVDWYASLIWSANICLFQGAYLTMDENWANLAYSFSLCQLQNVQITLCFDLIGHLDTSQIKVIANREVIPSFSRYQMVWYFLYNNAMISTVYILKHRLLSIQTHLLSRHILRSHFRHYVINCSLCFLDIGIRISRYRCLLKIPWPRWQLIFRVVILVTIGLPPRSFCLCTVTWAALWVCSCASPVCCRPPSCGPRDYTALWVTARSISTAFVLQF